MIDEHSAGADSVGGVVGMLRTLSDPTRLRLLTELQHGELSVSALCTRLHLAQPTVSHHLGRLRTARLVANRRDGKQVFYSLNDEIVCQSDGRIGLAIASGPLELRILGSDGSGDSSVNGEPY
jgi:ArsR family transcriptional regulator